MVALTARRRLLAATAGACCALPAGVAAADETIIAGPPIQYYTGSITIDQGEKVTFTNLDIADHDVVARDTDATGAPLFKSELIGRGASAPVVGVERLVTGSYAFFCSIHVEMAGSINVTSAGTPAPGGPTPGPGGGPDKTPPKVKLRVVDARIAAVLKRGALNVRVSTNEVATVGIVASAAKTRIASGTTSADPSAPRIVSLKLTAKGRKKLKQSKRLTISLRAQASDGGGNISSPSAARTLKR